MWRKIFKHGEQDTTSTSASGSQGEVIGKVLEQHPNLSMFRSGSQESAQPPASPPASPSKSRNLFKRASRVPPRDDDGRSPSPGPPKLTLGIPKKVKSSLSLAGNLSQSSLGRASGRNALASADADRRPSMDLLGSPSPPTPFDSVRSSPPDFNQRPSIDTLRTMNADNDDIRPLTPSGLPQGSVRSILRDPNTPGTGRNVRFFSRTLYQDPTPDQSTDNEYQPSHSAPVLGTESQHTGSLSEVVFRPSSSPKNARPSVAQVFSPLRQEPPETRGPDPDKDTSNFLGMSREIQLPELPPGLGFDLELDKALELPLSDGDNSREMGNVMTSTPYRGSLKAKGKERESTDSAQSPSLNIIDDGIFHSKEKSPKLPNVLHDRSHSFSFGGQTAFFSMVDASNRSSTSSAVPSLTSTETKSSPSPVSLRSTDSPSQSSLRGRSRALSDTVFHSILKSSPAKPPEADINDESSSELVVYEPVAKPEPDPFSATANTYYTPQTMIPVTPPKGIPGHARKTSREDSIIVSLQTQLALQTELCGQYEADLRARDEMVQILGQKVSDFEKDEQKRKGILRAWKKRVGELERQCRFLEDEVEGSRQESMERSIMDEASGEALRMLHRQIASLEREKGDMSRREDILREEVQTLENLVQERSEEIMNLKETVWSRDENQRAIQKGLQEAQEQIEQIGNISTVSMALFDSDDRDEERERHRLAEAEWEKQRLELTMAMEKTKAENVALEGETEKLRQQLKTNEDEMTMLKNELEAQWGHSEKASEKIELVEGEKRDLENERQSLSAEVEQLQERLGLVEGQKGDLEQECRSLNATIEQLEERIGNMDAEWEESENRQAELEEEKRALEDEMRLANEDLQEQLQSAKDQIRYKHEHAERIAQTMKEHETRLAELEMERQFSFNETSRLQTNLEQRDAEIAKYSSRVVEQEREIESLQERLSKINREHARIVSEQERALQAATQHDDETTEQMKDLLKRQGEQNVELHATKDKITNLQAEVDRLRRQVHTLQQESADREVKVVQLTKKHENALEDLSQMNMALDSKQQELELLKRKYQVRGTAGSTSVTNTPAPARRRDSTVFSTPSTSRPSSIISNSSDKETPSAAGTKERKLSSESITLPKANALAKSTRVNGSMGPPSTTKPRLPSIGPPPKRMSVGGTPTPVGRIASLSRSSSAKPTAASTSNSTSSSGSTPSVSRPSSVTAHHRRTSAMSGGSTSSVSSSSGIKRMPSAPTATPSKEVGNSTLGELQEDEKENRQVDATPSSTQADRRRSMIPTPA